MERKKLFNILSLVCNVLMFGLTTWAVAFYFYSDTGSGNMLAHGFDCFRFFTIDSNVLAAIASAKLLTIPDFVNGFLLTETSPILTASKRSFTLTPRVTLFTSDAFTFSAAISFFISAKQASL